MDPNTSLAAWALTDARRIARDSCGSTVYLSSWAQCTPFQAGDRVGLVFLLRGCDRHGAFLQKELVWLTVRAKCQSAYLGTLDSVPALCTHLRAGDAVAFAPQNVSLVRCPPRPGRPPHPRPRLPSWRWLLRLDG